MIFRRLAFRPCRLAAAGAVAALLLAPEPAKAQHLTCSPPPSDDELPSFAITQLDSATHVRLMRDLGDGCWARALNDYFKKFRPELADWVVYVDGDGNVTQGFTIDGKVTPRFREQRYVWAVVFMAHKPAALPIPSKATPPTPSTPSPPTVSSLHYSSPPTVLDVQLAADKSTSGPPAVDTMDLRFARRVVAYHKSPVISLIVKVLGKVVGVDQSADPTIADSTRAIRLDQVWDTHDTTLYVGYGRFGLIDNSQVELALSPLPGMAIARATQPPAVLSVYGNFANAREHTFELGLVAGASRGERVAVFNANQQVTSESPRWTPNGFISVDLNVPGLWFAIPGIPNALRPTWQRASVGLFGATNALRGNIGDEVAWGLQVGHLIGDAGLIAGIDYATAPKLVNGVARNERIARWLFGFDVRL